MDAPSHLPPESSLCSDLHALPGPRGTSLSTLDLTVHTGCVTPLEIPHAPTPRSVLLLPGPSPLPVCRPLAPGQIPTGLESQAGLGEAAEACGLCGRAGRGSSDDAGQAVGGRYMVKEPPKAPWRPFARGSRGLSRQMGHRVQDRELGGPARRVWAACREFKAVSRGWEPQCGWGEGGWRVPTKLLPWSWKGHGHGPGRAERSNVGRGVCGGRSSRQGWGRGSAGGTPRRPSA